MSKRKMKWFLGMCFFSLSLGNRQLEQKWSQKKIKLHQKLALRLFQDDVKQVLDWLENHGEAFLRKNEGIGCNLTKAKAYQKSHKHFEYVTQVT